MGCGVSSVAKGVAPDEPVQKRHFDVERVVGHGGFGKVNAVVKNRGYDKGTWYAMKTLSKSVILERNHVAMVMQERNLLARLHCPQLVNMHYAFQDARNLYIVMDACLGGDLHYQLMHSPDKSFPEHQARFYVASIIVCLEYMHSLGVLHRDVKPENLLLDARGQLKVTDLGISMEMKDGVCTSTSGTRPYMAPEVFMSGHKHSTVADFYSLGITTYQFLVGSRPYRPESNNMRAIVRMAMFVPPEKYTDVRQIRRILIAAQERKAPSQEFQYSRRMGKFSAEARDFVQSCLICNPKYRLGSGGIIELLEHPWFAGLDWDAIRSQEYPAPFVPDTTKANCAISPEDLQQMVLNEEEQEMGPEIPLVEQKKFEGYNYRVWAQDETSGRTERVIRRVQSYASRHDNATLTAGVHTEYNTMGAAYPSVADHHKLRSHRTSDTGMMNASFQSLSSFHNPNPNPGTAAATGQQQGQGQGQPMQAGQGDKAALQQQQYAQQQQYMQQAQGQGPDRSSASITSSASSFAQGQGQGQGQGQRRSPAGTPGNSAVDVRGAGGGGGGAQGQGQYVSSGGGVGGGVGASAVSPGPGQGQQQQQQQQGQAGPGSGDRGRGGRVGGVSSSGGGGGGGGGQVVMSPGTTPLQEAQSSSRRRVSAGITTPSASSTSFASPSTAGGPMMGTGTGAGATLSTPALDMGGMAMLRAADSNATILGSPMGGGMVSVMGSMGPGSLINTPSMAAMSMGGGGTPSSVHGGPGGHVTSSGGGGQPRHVRMREFASEPETRRGSGGGAGLAAGQGAEIGSPQGAWADGFGPAAATGTVRRSSALAQHSVSALPSSSQQQGGGGQAAPSLMAVGRQGSSRAARGGAVGQLQQQAGAGPGPGPALSHVHEAAYSAVYEEQEAGGDGGQVMHVHGSRGHKGGGGYGEEGGGGLQAATGLPGGSDRASPVKQQPRLPHGVASPGHDVEGGSNEGEGEGEGSVGGMHTPVMPGEAH